MNEDYKKSFTIQRELVFAAERSFQSFEELLAAPYSLFFFRVMLWNSLSYFFLCNVQYCARVQLLLRVLTSFDPVPQFSKDTC